MMEIVLTVKITVFGAELTIEWVSPCDHSITIIEWSGFGWDVTKS